ncbi:MAG: serine hydrolase [Planctomycetes bacterium]|nr:serine hydrolase [Planctomycetota bacterium]
MRSLTRSVFCFVALLWFVLPAAGQDLPTAEPGEVGMSAERLAGVDTVVRKFIDEKQLAGAVTIVARRGKVVQFKAYGMRDIAAKKPMTKDTIFRIYSMTKAVVSVAAMILVEDGKLELDVPASKYIPALGRMKVGGAKQQREMTLRDLLRHTAGFPNNVTTDRALRKAGHPALAESTLEEMMNRLDAVPLIYQPGKGWHYSFAADYMRFCLMLTGQGEFGGRRLLKAKTVRMMTRNQLPEGVGEISRHPKGRGFGLGFAVRIRKIDSSPLGEYEWLGGLGTEFFVSPSDELAVITLSNQSPMRQIKRAVRPVVYAAIEKDAKKAAATKVRRNRYLVLDSRIIESKENAKLTPGVVKKNENNPLFVEDKPWEPRYDNMYPNVIYDEEEKLYKCWYCPFIVDRKTTSTPVEKRNPESRRYMNARPSGREEALLYATSKDGIHWEKPQLGIVEFHRSKKNNIVCRGLGGSGVIKDRRDPNPKRRYKAFYCSDSGYKMRYSSDGLHWGAEVALPGVGESDCHANMIWSPELNKYVGILRHYDRVPITGNRKIARSESADSVKWAKSTTIIEGTPLKQLHDMTIFRDGGVYLGLLGCMNYPSMKSRDGVRQHVELAWSPDSYKWYRISPGTPLIAPTPTEETKYGKMPYDWGCIFTSTPIFREGEIQIYYGASDWYFFDWRKGGLALATLRPDGWAGYEQIDRSKPATITTTPLACVGTRLQVSADVSTGGSIRVTILDKDKRELAVAAAIRQTVTDGELVWPRAFSMKALKGARICLKFEFKDTKLYSFNFTSPEDDKQPRAGNTAPADLQKKLRVDARPDIAPAPEIRHVTIEPATADVPRSDTASIARLSDGRLMVVYHKYEKGKNAGHDHGVCRIWSKTSADDGLTWGHPRMLVDVAKGDMNVQAPGLLRTKSGKLLLNCLRAHKGGANSTMCLFSSSDDGKTFTEHEPLWKVSEGQLLQGGASSLMQLKSGRLLLPFHGGTGNQWKQKNSAWCLRSDDGGKTWSKSSAIDLPKRGAMEASVAELDGGELVMSLRTQLGGPYIAQSSDGGVTWSKAIFSNLEGGESCTALRRLPGTNKLVLFWNNSKYLERHHHLGERTPLTAALSEDGGKTWKTIGRIADDPKAEYANVDCFFTKDHAILTYMYAKPAWNRKQVHLKAAIIPMVWFDTRNESE